MEPGRIFDGTRQQVWKIDTAGAARQDMLDYQGDATGRPYRCWRGRHFQLPAPPQAPTVVNPMIFPDGTVSNVSKLGATTTTIPDQYKWSSTAYRRGKWAICYTYVLGRRDEEWQQSPLITPGGDASQDSSSGVTWAYKTGSIITTEN